MSGELPSPNFEDGWKVEAVADAILASGEHHGWTDVAT